MISGLSHITLIVKDLNKTTTFLREIFNAEEIYSSGDQTFSLSKEKFFSNCWPMDLHYGRRLFTRANLQSYCVPNSI